MTRFLRKCHPWNDSALNVANRKFVMSLQTYVAKIRETEYTVENTAVSKIDL